MDLNYEQFKEFMGQPESDSSDDEVFFAGKGKNIHYTRRKTEPFDPDFRTTRKSVLPSEDYFADVSRLSSRTMQITDSNADGPHQFGSFSEEPEPDNLFSTDQADLLGPEKSFHDSNSPKTNPSTPSEVPLENPENPNVSLASPFEKWNGKLALDNVHVYQRIRRSTLLSFQRFSSLASSSSGNEVKLQNAGEIAEPATKDGLSITDNPLPMTLEMGQNGEDASTDVTDCQRNVDCDNELSVAESDATSSNLHNLPLDSTLKEHGSAVGQSHTFSSPQECAFDSTVAASPSQVHEIGNDECGSEVDCRSSHLATDLQLDEDTSNKQDSVLRIKNSSESFRLHETAFIASACESRLSEGIDRKDCPTSILCDSGFSSSPAIVGLLLNSPRAPSSFAVSPRQFHPAINEQCGISKTPGEKDISQEVPPKSKEVPSLVISTAEASKNCEEQLELLESLDGNLREQNVVDHRGSDVPLADVCLPSILIDHFEHCLVDEEKIGEDTLPTPKETAQQKISLLDDSLNAPGCSGESPLRLTTETSDCLSSDDSDCDFSLEALRRWNQHLMDKDRMAKEISSGQYFSPVQRNAGQSTPSKGHDLGGQFSKMRDVEKRSVDGLSSILSGKSCVLNPSGALERRNFAIPSSQQRMELDLEIGGQGNFPTYRPSPSNLECLDLSVDERLPVGQYLEEFDKENWNKEARKRLPEKKATPKTPCALPMREISNSPAISKAPEFAAPKNPAKVATASAKKTGIPVIVNKSRHARCFNLYSTNKPTLQDLKEKSMKGFQHISSPVSKYIKEYPVSPFIQNLKHKSKLLTFQGVPVKTFFPPPTPLAHLPVARYVEASLPRMVDQPPLRYKYFPSPNTPLTIKHTGPSHVIPDVSCIHEDSILISGRKGSRIPHLKGARSTNEDSVWQVISPRNNP